MAKPQSPCKDCKDRHEACHATCDAYLKFTEDTIQFNKKTSEHNRKYERSKGSIYWH